MNDLTDSIALLGRPYQVTRSRLGAITKVYQDRYVCDLNSLREIFQAIGEKLDRLKPTAPPAFSLLISYSDQTHHDGVAQEWQDLQALPTGKQTERVVMRWVVRHDLSGEENELSVTLRVSNPINPLVFLQAALSKSPADLDNMEFELGSTCVTVDGAGQAYADEIFLRIRKWLDARSRPHPFLDASKLYVRFEWWVDQTSHSLLPFLVLSALSILAYNNLEEKAHLAFVPLFVALFFVLRTVAVHLNRKMVFWAKRSQGSSVFSITNGDEDAVTRMAAAAKNGALKLVGSAAISFLLNVAAGLACWWLLVG